MSTQVEQIERTQGSVDGYEIDVGLVDDEKHDSFDVGALKADPDVGVAWVNCCRMRLRCDEVLPATVMILGANGVQYSRVVEAGLGIAEGVDGDTAQLGDDVPRFVIAGEVAGHVEHGLVEGEISVKAGVLAERFHATGYPAVVGVSWSFGRRRWCCGLSLYGDWRES
jgi:hypothetical protein